MPDNGEHHEIRQRTNALEAEIAFETTKLLRKGTAELEGALTSPDHHGRENKRSLEGMKAALPRISRRSLNQH
jgi:hypothetical protein